MAQGGQGWFGALALVVAAALSGCAGSGSPTGTSDATEYSREAVDAAKDRSRATLTLAEGDLASPVVRGGANGLEVVWFVALDAPLGEPSPAPDDEEPTPAPIDGRCAIARALAPYLEQPLPISDATRERLERNGLRMVRVPLADVETIVGALRIIGPRQREWMGWALERREAFRGRSLTEGSAALVEGERTTLPACALRLIARCWTAPGAIGSAAAAPVVRVEIVAQAMRRTRSAESGLSPERPTLDARDDGQLLMSLAWEGALEPGSAYMIVPEGPGVSWREGASRLTRLMPDEGGLFPSTDAGPRSGGAGARMGPAAFGPPTLGEAMMMNLARQEHEQAARAVVVFIPRAGQPGAPLAHPPAPDVPVAEASSALVPTTNIAPVTEAIQAPDAEHRTKIEPGRVRESP